MKAIFLLGLVQARAKVYKHMQSYVAADFFSHWTFWSEEDPTHGAVNYIGHTEAAATGFARATADQVYLGVDMQAVLADDVGRRSVRVQSKAAYSGGLFFATIDHIPTGCGLWPSFWMFGADAEHPWPKWGEYDVIEGVHTATRVMTSLHTGPNCSQSTVGPGSGHTVEWLQGRRGGPADNCDVTASDQWQNQGCSQQGPRASMGVDFNVAGGGSYAAEWNPEAKHIRTWFWPKGLEPSELLKRGTPDPAAWGPPYSYFSLQPGRCDPSHFANMRLVFDITFCGDLGEPTFASSCPEQAQSMTCRQLVARHPEFMKEAYWSIRALDVYQLTHAPVQPGPLRPSGEPPTWRWFFAALGPLAVVIALYAVVWRKVQQDGPNRSGIVGLYGHYERAPQDVPSKPQDEENESWTAWTKSRLWPGSAVAWLWSPLSSEDVGQGDDKAGRPRSSSTSSDRSRSRGLSSGMVGGGKDSSKQSPSKAVRKNSSDSSSPA